MSVQNFMKILPDSPLILGTAFTLYPCKAPLCVSLAGGIQDTNNSPGLSVCCTCTPRGLDDGAEKYVNNCFC